MSDVDVLIAGGGISGLATAWWLARKGISVEVWESESCPGGKIQTDSVAGYQTERAAALVMNFRPEVNRLIKESGLEACKTSRTDTAARYIVCDGHLHPVPLKLGSLVTSPLWSRRGNLRLLAEPFIAKGDGEQETVSEFIRRRLGDEVLQKVMEPYVAGPLASDADRANAQAVLPRLIALEQRYGSLAVGVVAHRLLRRRTGCPTESFSFTGGMSTLIGALATAAGVRLRLRRQVVAIAPAGDHAWSVIGHSPQGEHRRRTRRLVLSVPADTAAGLVGRWDGELERLLHGIDYAPIAAVHLGLDRAAVRHPLDGAGFLAPRRERLPVNGVLWMSSLFPDRAPPGKVLVTAYVGGARLPEAVNWYDHYTVDRVMTALKPLLGLDAAPEWVRIDRHHRALPLYHGAYCRRMEAVSAALRRLPGLHLEANYRGGVSVRDRIVCAQAAAQHIASGLRAQATVGPRMSARPDLAPEFGT